jgi:hypothetical protein
MLKSLNLGTNRLKITTPSSSGFDGEASSPYLNVRSSENLRMPGLIYMHSLMEQR